MFEILAKWQKDHPDTPFPSWPTFTGFASTHHTPQGPVQCQRLLKDHPILKDVENYTSHKDSELYNNFIGPVDKPDVVSILKGKNPQNEAVMLWENKVGGSKVISFTLGHSMGEWKQAQFQQILTNTVNYLGR